MLTMWRVSLVLLMFLFAGSAYSNPPSPAPSDTKQKNQTHTDGKQQPAAIDQRGSESSPLFIKVIPPLTVEPSPAKEAEHARDYTSAEWWLVWVTLILAAITAALARYTAKLWGATKSLAEDAERTATKQATDMETSLGIAKESADAAKKSADAAGRTVNTMKETAERQLRAYVMVDCVEFINKMVGPSLGFTEQWIHVRFKNFGQVPATAIGYWFVIGTQEFPLHSPLVGNHVPQTAGPIAPHDTFTSMLKLELIDSPDEDAALYIFGEVRYFDGFVPNRVTNFRYMRRGGHDWLRDGELEVCQEGNGIT